MNNNMPKQKITNESSLNCVACEKHRMYLIDIMRIICAFLIYARHSITMYGCSYGKVVDALFVELTSPVMTCFFILSGFSIHYQHRLEQITSAWTRTYLKKRILSIMPSYLLVVLIWPIFYPEQLNNWAILLPVDLLGIQTSYRSLFGILHNGGTWFVSCLLLAYVLYPVIKAVYCSEMKWVPFVMIILIHFILIYSNLIIPKFSLDGLYSNPLARTAEFLAGVSFAEIVFGKKKRQDLVGLWVGWQYCFIILCLGCISVVIGMINQASLKMIIFGYLSIPIILVFLVFASTLRCKCLERSKTISILSGMSYQFFLTQLFLWEITSWLLKMLNIDGNIAKILGSFTICILISFAVWRFFDKPIRRLLSGLIISSNRKICIGGLHKTVQDIEGKEDNETIQVKMDNIIKK